MGSKTTIYSWYDTKTNHPYTIKNNMLF